MLQGEMGKGHSLQLLTQQIEPWSRDQVETVFSPSSPGCTKFPVVFFGDPGPNPHAKWPKDMFGL